MDNTQGHWTLRSGGNHMCHDAESFEVDPGYSRDVSVGQKAFLKSELRQFQGPDLTGLW